MNLELRNDGLLTGRENMQRDLQLIDRVRTASVDLVLRLYQWSPWCVSLGANQQSDRLDREACRARNIDIVERPTGGRAVLHANELTYAFATRIPSGKSAMDVYRAFHRMLHEALVHIAPEISLSSLAPSLREHYAASGPLGQVCFSAHAPSELLWDNRKVVGSAQRVVDGIILQHGSILCGPGHEQLGMLLHGEHETRIRIVEATQRASATLSEAAGRTVEPAEIAVLLEQRLTLETLSGLV